MLSLDNPTIILNKFDTQMNQNSYSSKRLGHYINVNGKYFDFKIFSNEQFHNQTQQKQLIIKVIQELTTLYWKDSSLIKNPYQDNVEKQQIKLEYYIKYIIEKELRKEIIRTNDEYIQCYLDKFNQYILLQNINKLINENNNSEAIECKNSIIDCQKICYTLKEYQNHFQNECDYTFNDNGILRKSYKQGIHGQNYEKYKQLQKQDTQSVEPYYTQMDSGQSTSDDENNQTQTLYISQYPKRGALEIFKPFGKILKFGFNKTYKKNTGEKTSDLYIKYQSDLSMQVALEQLNGLFIKGQEMRVSRFYSKQTINDLRVYIKDIKTSNKKQIKFALEELFKNLNNDEVILINTIGNNGQNQFRKTYNYFIQFDIEHKHFKEQLIDKDYQTIIGKIQFRKYKPNNNQCYVKYKSSDKEESPKQNNHCDYLERFLLDVEKQNNDLNIGKGFSMF